MRPERHSAAVREAIRSELDSDASDAGGTVTERREGRPVVELEHVYLSFDEPVLQDVSLAAAERETFVILGESGTGKSTILKLLLRLLVPDRGAVRIDGEDITALTFDDALKVRKKMGMVFQGAALFDSLNVFVHVAYPLR